MKNKGPNAWTLSRLGFVLTLFFGLSHADNRVKAGVFTATAAGTTAGYSITGTALIARHGDSLAYVVTHVMGLKPGATYGSHVHNLPCSMGGGAHYKIDPSIDSTVAGNEVWPLLHTDTSGTANAFVTSTHGIRPEGQSIVIHDTTAGKEKIACADLVDTTKGAVMTSGDFMRFADTATTLAGTASMVRDGDSTVASLSVTGLLPNTAYGCHVHLLPGAIQKGGGHYKIDPAITTAVDSNEIWLNFTSDSTGKATKTVTVHAMARPEAQSMVIHAPGGTRIGWVDLLPPASTGLASNAIITGYLGTTEAGLGADYWDMIGQGLIVRAQGMTVAALKVSGLVPNSAYGSHVHDLPCALGGGAHYKVDPSVTTADAANEIWTLLKTDSAGNAIGYGFSSQLARLEAQSIVVHDTVNGARIGCIDLAQAGLAISSIRGAVQVFPGGPVPLAGSGEIIRSAIGTSVTLKVTGLAPNTAYPAHVHNLPGTVQSGGLHYKMDPGISVADSANEIWMMFTTDSSGSAEVTATLTNHVARIEAQSIVIHSADGATRIGWVDLPYAGKPVKLNSPAKARSKSLVDMGSNNFRIHAQGRFTATLYSLQGKGVQVRSGSGNQIVNFNGTARGFYILRVKWQDRSMAPVIQNIFIR